LDVGDFLDLALEKNILQKRGSWISYKGQQLAQGRDATKEAPRADQSLYQIEVAVKAALDEEAAKRK
jgi:recombination protein RecA